MQIYLEAAGLGVLSTSTEQTWGFDPVIANLLLATIQVAGSVHFVQSQLFLLGRLLLVLGHVLPLLFLSLVVLIHRSKVALFKAGDLG